MPACLSRCQKLHLRARERIQWYGGRRDDDHGGMVGVCARHGTHARAEAERQGLVDVPIVKSYGSH